MDKLLRIVIAGAAMAASVQDASAQRYYAREKLMQGAVVTAPAVTYTPTYTEIYGSCSGGTQSTPIKSCAASDGNPATNAQCGSSRQTKSRACTMKCGTFQEGWWANPNRGADYSATSTLADAPAACATFSNTAGKTGFCGYYGPTTGNGTAYYIVGSSTSDQNLGSAYRATTCQVIN